MEKIVSGNLDEEVSSHPETMGWFLGHFMTKYPDFMSDEVELKWARHEKGDKKDRPQAKTTTKTITILISGKFLIRFPKKNHDVILARLGDFIYYDASQDKHTREALEDSLLLVIRFPSKS